MKAIPSVAFASFSGKAGPVVAANWKGIQYIRSYVIPANPQSTAQIVQRNRNTCKVWMWQELSVLWRQAWAAFIAGEAQSDFNAFVGFNKVDPMADPGLIASPFNPDVDPIDDFAFVDAGSQVVNLTWTDPTIPNSKVLVFVHEQMALPATLMTRDDFPAGDLIQCAEVAADAATWSSEAMGTGSIVMCYAAFYDPTVALKKFMDVNGISKSAFTKLPVV